MRMIDFKSNTPPLTPQERQLIDIFRELMPKYQYMVLDMVNTCLSAQRNELEPMEFTRKGK